jgi:hypothetical protein
MVFTSLNPARETYMLWRRFRMPTQHGSKDAVAVEVNVANQLNSAYTFMLEHIVLLTWSITVLVGLLISIRKYAHNHPNRPLSQDIWRKRASPFDILKLAFRHLRKEKSARWLIIPWLFIAIAFVVVKYTVPSMYSKVLDVLAQLPSEILNFYILNMVSSHVLSLVRRLLTTRLPQSSSRLIFKSVALLQLGPKLYLFLHETVPVATLQIKQAIC